MTAEAHKLYVLVRYTAQKTMDVLGLERHRQIDIAVLIDDCALTDRFLAERPFTARDFKWRVGDYHRALPDGYLEAVRQNNPELVVSELDGFRLKELWSNIRPSQELP